LLYILQKKIQALLPYDSRKHPSKSTTTISHTFAEHNTVITIYVVGPMSLLFLFRVNRTLRDDKLSQYARKMVLIVLLSVQYSTLVVVRYDTIKGFAHYFFTAMTFVSLLLYHGIVSNRGAHWMVDLIKPMVGVASVLLMCGFGAMISFVTDIRNRHTYWTMCCYMEILALLLLGSLDILDIYVLGLSIQS